MQRQEALRKRLWEKSPEKASPFIRQIRRIASEADAGKNRLSTRKFSFSDLKNEASMPSNTIVTDIKDTMTGK